MNQTLASKPAHVGELVKRLNDPARSGFPSDRLQLSAELFLNLPPPCVYELKHKQWLSETLT